MIFVMDVKTITLSVLLVVALAIAVAGTYYQTIVLESFEYYQEEELDITQGVTD